MRKSLSTLAMAAGIAVGASAYDARADSPVEGPATDRYVPSKIENISTNEQRSTKDAKIGERTVNINGQDFIVYANEFAKEDELGFMLRNPNDAVDVYNFFDGEATAERVPTDFYIPTRVTGKNSKGEDAIAPKFTLATKALEGIPVTLKTFKYDGGEFFHPNATGSNEFYFIPVIGESENLVVDRRTNDITIFGEDGDGVWERGEGIFALRKATYEEIAGRKQAFDEAQAKIAEEQRLEKERLEAEAKQQKLEELKAPKAGKGKIDFN